MEHMILKVGNNEYESVEVNCSQFIFYNEELPDFELLKSAYTYRSLFINNRYYAPKLINKEDANEE